MGQLSDMVYKIPMLQMHISLLLAKHASREYSGTVYLYLLYSHNSMHALRIATQRCGYIPLPL